jgi:iron(III) transport system substrate-binding protein
MRNRVLAAALAATFLLTSCGAPADQGTAAAAVEPVSDLDSLVSSAKEEGKLLLYTSLTESDMEAMTAGFTEKYGIEVQALRLGGTDAATRFDTEASANAPSADLLVLADPTYIGDLTSTGKAVPLEETGLFSLLDNIPKHLKAPEIGSAVVQIVNSGIAYNTDLVSPDEVPDSWEDLLDERWKGKLIGTTPESSMNNLVTWGQLYDEFGADFVKSIGTQVSRVYPNMVPMHEALAAGDGEIALQSAQFFIEGQKAAGKHLEFLNLSPSVYPVHALGISARAKSPYAARLFSHYLMTEEGAGTISNAQIGSFSAYDEELIPDDFAIVSNEKKDRYEGMKKEISEAFGKQ